MKIRIMLLLCVILYMATGCTNDFVDESGADKKNEYMTNWIKQFGLIDSDHTWNAAKAVKVDVVPSSFGSDATVKIYTSNPMSGGKLIGRASSTTTMKMDVERGTEAVYVQAVDSEGHCLKAGYYDIKDGLVSIVGDRASSRAASDISLGDSYTFDFSNGTENVPQTYQRINGVETSNNKTAMYRDIVPLFGVGGHFQEQSDPSCLEKFKDDFAPDVMFTVTGELTLDYMYGATGNSNVFGYYYWQEGEDPNAATKYILIDDARPQANIYKNSLDNPLSDGNELASIFYWSAEYGKPEETDNFLIGTSYKVPYFDSEGNASYSFPANTNIAFFLIVNGRYGTDNWLYLTNRSVQSHNHYFGRYFTGYSRNTSSTDSTQGEIDAVSFKYGNQIYLGFEDRGGDKDMNDIMFFVTGAVTPKSRIVDFDPQGGVPEAPYQWMIACEDMGSTADYDFNDIVFGVSYVAGDDFATITPLAAGGIYHSEIWYNGQPIRGTGDESEIHYLINGSTSTGTYPMLNTLSVGTPGISFPISIGATEFTIQDFLNKLALRITERKEHILIHAPFEGDAPQVICVPSNWRWPREYVGIVQAYPRFSDWTEDNENLDWISSMVPDKVVK